MEGKIGSHDVVADETPFLGRLEADLDAA